MKITSTYDGVTSDYHSKRKEVMDQGILAPRKAPEWVHDRRKLWNEVERVERRKDAQLFRSFDIALPVELGLEEQKKLIRDFCQKAFVDRGMIADFALHDKKDGNPHFHVGVTMRMITPEGFGKKNRDWNDRSLLDDWRRKWAKCANAALRRGHHLDRIDARSLEDQGIDRVPTQHRGPGVDAMRKRGIGINKLVEDELERVVAEKAEVEATLAKLERERRDLETAAAAADSRWGNERGMVLATTLAEVKQVPSREGVIELYNACVSVYQEIAGIMTERHGRKPDPLDVRKNLGELVPGWDNVESEIARLAPRCGLVVEGGVLREMTPEEKLFYTMREAKASPTPRTLQSAYDALVASGNAESKAGQTSRQNLDRLATRVGCVYDQETMSIEPRGPYWDREWGPETLLAEEVNSVDVGVLEEDIESDAVAAGLFDQGKVDGGVKKLLLDEAQYWTHGEGSAQPDAARRGCERYMDLTENLARAHAQGLAARAGTPNQPRLYIRAARCHVRNWQKRSEILEFWDAIIQALRALERASRQSGRGGYSRGR